MLNLAYHIKSFTELLYLNELSELYMLNSMKEYIECYNELKNLLIKDFKNKIK